MHSSNDNPQPATSHAVETLRGRTVVPGDKSISHRALMLASQALGTTTIHGLLEGEDVLRTAEALRQCGVPITRHADGHWTAQSFNDCDVLITIRRSYCDINLDSHGDCFNRRIYSDYNGDTFDK